MRLEFEATTDDYLALWEEDASRKAGGNRQPTPTGTWVVLLSGFAIAGAAGAMVTAAQTLDNLAGGAFAGLLGGWLGWSVLYLLYSRCFWSRQRQIRAARETVRRMIRTGEWPVDLGPHAVVVEGEWVSWETPTQMVRQPIAVFDALEDRPDALYMTRAGQIRFRLPTRAFSSEAQQDEFRQLITSHLTAAPHQAVTPG